MPRKAYKHVTKCNRYAREIVSGKRIAGKFTRLACERHLSDFDRKEWKFDPAKANRACSFIEKLHHVKGRWAAKGATIKLEPWQCFFVCCIFGWVERSSGLRRFTEAYLRVARKNGKSIIAAAIGLYMFVEDGEYGAEIYSGATSEKQAWEVFRPARLMAKRHPQLAKKYGVEINAKNMNVMADDSRFEPVIGNPGDGSSPSLAIIDEYHEHSKPDMYETMSTGMAAREQPLILIITTAGTNIASPCFEKDDEIKKILEGNYKDDSIFGLIYEPDEEDHNTWMSVTAMKKSNPNLDVSVSKRYLQRRLGKALRSPSDQATYKTKHLNIWVGSGATFLNPLEWNRCEAVPAIRIEDFLGEDWSCVFGLDLASRIDFVALMRLFFKKQDAENLLYAAFPMFWLPENRVDEDVTGQYERWAEAGHMIMHEDDEIDFAMLRADIIEQADLCSPLEIAYDPWRAMGVEQELTKKGLTMVKIPQTIASFTDPMNELEAAHLSKRIAHDGNPIMNWMISNLVAREDTNGNKKPRREIAKNKIDGPVALLEAMNRAMALDETGGFVTGRLTVL